MFEVEEATREQAPITAAFIGGSGSGKTYSALLFARGLVGPDGKIVVIDAEGGRCRIYYNWKKVGKFRLIDIVEPWTSERFRAAFNDALKQADAVIIDTASHEHQGFLEYADQEEARMRGKKGASRNKWIKPKAARKRFYSAISSSRAHVVITIRLNRGVDMDVTPAVEIFRPECDKDLPYKMDLCLEINKDHTIKIIKVPDPLVGILKNGDTIGIEHGQRLAADISQQADVDPVPATTIKALEDASEMGTEALKTAYSASWRAAGPADDLKKDTPARKELKKHLPRLKALALAADTSDEDDGPVDDVDSELFKAENSDTKEPDQ